MFKDKYQRDNEKITVDPAVKQYIGSKLRGEKSQTEKRPSRKRIPVTAFVAAALSVCMAVGVVFVAGQTSEPEIKIADTGLVTNLSYDNIYSSIRSLSKKSIEDYIVYSTGQMINLFGGKGKDLEMLPEYAVDEIGGGSNGTFPENESSTTNNQVQGVDEADRVKNDGKYIYVLSKGSITIVDSNGGQPKTVSKLDVTVYDEWANEFYVSGDRLAVIVSSGKTTESAQLRIFDISDKKNPSELATVSQSGYVVNSRMVGNTVYLLSNYMVYSDDIKRNDPATFVPCVGAKPVSAEDISLINDFSYPTYLVIAAIDLKAGEVTASESVLGGAENIYCDTDSLYYTFTKYNEDVSGNKTKFSNRTTIVKLALSAEDITVAADGSVEGVPLNQFSMDEYEGNLRIVTTVDKTVTTDVEYTDDIAVSSETSSVESGRSNALYVLDENLNIIGSITDLAKDERVYSVRFDGEIGYFVTFRQVDPLFTVDLSNPEKPKILGELKIPGFSEYLHPFGKELLFGFGKSATENGLVTGLKLSMFNVADPSNVTEQDVTPIDAAWSEASSNHKAIMVDAGKNLIAFSATDDLGRSRVYVYGYTADKGFYERAELTLSEQYADSVRLMWIGNHFYVISESEVAAYTMDIFAPTATLTIY